MEKNKILTICKMVTEITDDEIAEVRNIIDSQSGYNNPLRMGTTGRLNDLARHNQKCLDAVLHLRDIIASGAEL